MKVIGDDIHMSVYNKRDDYVIPIDNFPWLVSDVLDSHPMVFTFPG